MSEFFTKVKAFVAEHKILVLFGVAFVVIAVVIAVL